MVIGVETSSISFSSSYRCSEILLSTVLIKNIDNIKLRTEIFTNFFVSPNTSQIVFISIENKNKLKIAQISNTLKYFYESRD